jgi:TPP-dependent pyruvate/acetoin dehydrogenase alpha subunit
MPTAMFPLLISAHSSRLGQPVEHLQSDEDRAYRKGQAYDRLHEGRYHSDYC